MNDTEFETLARTSAATLRAEAERIADSDSALQALLEVAGSSGIRSGTPDAEIIDLDKVHPIRRRTVWLPLTAAAAVIATIAGVAFLTNRSDDDPAVTTDPITAPVIVTQPSPDPTVTAPVETIDGTTPETPPTTDPADRGAKFSFVDPVVLDETVVVPDDRGSQLARTVLATFDVGSGDGSLGFDRCDACGTQGPWAPIVTDDGTVFVADAANDRWMIFRNGSWSSRPYGTGEVVTATPVVGPDGLIYAMVADSIDMPTDFRVVTYEPSELSKVSSQAATDGAVVFALDVFNSNVIDGTLSITDIEPRSDVTFADVGPGSVTLERNGDVQRFEIPGDWRVDGRRYSVLDDGSIVVSALVPTVGDEFDTILMRFWNDGSFAVGSAGPALDPQANPFTTRANRFDTRYSSDGLIRLEDGEIVRYAWPEFTAPDPLAGWEFPQFAAPNLDAVPYLVPTVKTPTGVVSERTEWAGPVSERVSYVQTWARADDTGAVTGIVQLTTSLDPNLVTAVDRAVEISGWDQAYFNASTPEVAILRLHTATRSMVVWTSGLDQDTTAEIARSLTVDDDGAGWATPFTSSSDTWTPIAQGWSAGMASRTFRQSVPGQPLTLELWTAAGVPDAVGTPGLTVSPDTSMTLVDVNGRTALVTDRGFNSAVTWQETPEVVVLLGVDGSTDDALAVARSITEVDRATWLAAAVEQQGDGDGCDGMFC